MTELRRKALAAYSLIEIWLRELSSTLRQLG